jgi:hypothetical protein
MTIVDFLPVPDALGRDPLLVYGDVLPVLGIHTEFRTNSRYVLGVVDEAFGSWRDVFSVIPSAARNRQVMNSRSLASLGMTDERMVSRDIRLSVRIVVRDGEESGAAHTPIQHICPDAERVVARSAGSVGISDPARHESVAYVTTALAADRAHFRGAIVEALTFALIAQFDRHPIHAAAIACDGRALLLVGESGSGKSTLAFAARSAGFDVLSEDHTWIQLEPEMRVWGSARRIRLASDAVRHFPDAAATGTPETVGGKTKLAIDVVGGTLMARDAVVCLLTRSEGEASVEKLPAATIVESLIANVDAGFDRFPSRHERVARALAARGGWRLRVSADPVDALPFLEHMLTSAD